MSNPKMLNSPDIHVMTHIYENLWDFMWFSQISTDCFQAQKTPQVGPWGLRSWSSTHWTPEPLSCCRLDKSFMLSCPWPAEDFHSIRGSPCTCNNCRTGLRDSGWLLMPSMYTSIWVGIFHNERVKLSYFRIQYSCWNVYDLGIMTCVFSPEWQKAPMHH